MYVDTDMLLAATPFSIAMPLLDAAPELIAGLQKSFCFRWCRVLSCFQAAHDGSNVYFLLKIPGSYIYTAG